MLLKTQRSKFKLGLVALSIGILGAGISLIEPAGPFPKDWLTGFFVGVALAGLLVMVVKRAGRI